MAEVTATRLKLNQKAREVSFVQAAECIHRPVLFEVWGRAWVPYLRLWTSFPRICSHADARRFQRFSADHRSIPKARGADTRTLPGTTTALSGSGPVLLFLACTVERIVPFSAPFDIQMQRQSYSRVIETQGERFLRQAQSEEEQRELKARYDEHTVHLSKSIVILQVPLFALLLGLLFAGWKRFFVEHMVFAFHFYSFFLLGLCLVGAFVIGLFVAGHALGLIMAGFLEKGLMLLLGGISMAWLYLALRRYYGCGMVSALLRALVLGICALPLMELYRWLLFYTTIWTL